MPIWRNRNKGDHVKVFRPDDSLTAEFRAPVNSDADAGTAAVYALMGAIESFRSEHGRMPEREKMVIELCGGTFSITCTVFELSRIE